MTALRFERELPAAIDAVVLVGSTCTGKTTLMQALRAANVPGIAIPRRYVTRAPRPDDIEYESRYVTKAELAAAVAAGDTALHWSRLLEAGHTEEYAFARVPDSALPVYSANNAIYIPGNVQPPDALARALMVGLYAPDEVRYERLRARSPLLWRDHPAEAKARLSDRAENVVPHVHAVIENHGDLEHEAAQAFIELVRSVAEQQR